MSLSARDENAKALAKLLELDDETAAELLCITVLARVAADAASRAIGRHLTDLLTRTVDRVVGHDDGTVKVEVAVGEVHSPGPWPVVRVGVARAEIVVSCEEMPEHDASTNAPEIVLLLVACYAAGMAVRLGLGHEFPLPHANTIRIPWGRLIRDRGGLGRVDVGKVYVAGAGAIGNGFIRALSVVDVHGEIHVVDPKRVTAGNLGRCVWFEHEDIGRTKAESLTARAQPAMPGATLVPRVSRVQDLEERSVGPWLERLVVAVDSRRARRRLQEELPREVFDASTTGIEEVVLHFNRASGDGACLSCIYAEDPDEAAHEKHVAATLGVSITDVQEHYIGTEAARLVAKRHPDLDPVQLVGTAYDTLFKSLCATGQLGVEEGRTVLAPFSFVSTLAGAYLALEFVLRGASSDVARPFNYWRASPWTSPMFELQALRAARPTCETCGNAVIRATINKLWEWGGKKAS